jgi:hypothetical protein
MQILSSSQSVLLHNDVIQNSEDAYKVPNNNNNLKQLEIHIRPCNLCVYMF